MDYSKHINAERILQDGWDLFQQKGYLGVSMEEICQSCGITKPTLYYYFKNKENLFVEILLRRLRGFRQVIELNGELEEKLVRIAVVMFDSFITDYSYLVRDLAHIKNPENAQRVREAFIIELVNPINALIQSGTEEGHLVGETKFLTHLFMGMVENFIAQANEFGLDNESLAKYLVGFFLKGAQPHLNHDL